MGKKIRKNEIEKYTACLLSPIKRAAELGKWTGFDGALQYIAGDVMQVIKKRFGLSFHDAALSIFFYKIAEITEKKHEVGIMGDFAQQYPNIVLNCAKNDPMFFIMHVDVVSFCCGALKRAQAKKLKKYIADYGSNNSNQENVDNLANVI